ncbi:MAG: hypothetical protein U5K31_02065 [Balneolaceae bacterium]|nr:hypothetical protein [Balneolaceae bacterium]
MDDGESFRGIEISSIGILHNEEKYVADHLAKITDLPFDKVVGISPDNEFIDEFLTFNSELALNELILFNKNGDLIFRIFLPSGEITQSGRKKAGALPSH